MSDHYYTNKPQSNHEVKEIEATIGQHSLRLTTDSGVFSKNRMDFGSKLLVESFLKVNQLDQSTALLELGSGYGPLLLSVAIHFPAANYLGIELNERALELAKENSLLNHLPLVNWLQADATELELDPIYDFVLTNPPIRAGKQVIRTFVEKAYDGLKKSGELWLVIQKKQGAPSMLEHMEELFGQVELVERDKGYWILKSVK